MWKKNLNTDKDPSNGVRWNTDGANHDGIGLYGGLTDSIDTAATFNEANKNYSPTQKLAASSVVDNRNGLVAQTVTQQVSVNVPVGKVYKAVLIGSAQQIDVPYRVNVHVSGATETWFEDRVNDHYNWMMDIGSAFAIAGNPKYVNIGKGQGKPLIVAEAVGSVLNPRVELISASCRDPCLQPVV